MSARFVGLLAGGIVLFFGSRSFAFRAGSGSVSRQAKLFVASEIVGFPLNLIVFKLLLGAIHFVPPELLSLLANFLLFITYYYPVRSRLVFRMQQPLVAQVVRFEAPAVFEAPAPSSPRAATVGSASSS